MYRELRFSARPRIGDGPEKTLRQAMWQIIVADLSMNLDNVLAVAGAAHGHPWVLSAGLLLSVVLMVVATAIARLLARYRWIRWGVGLVIVLRVAVGMIWTGDGGVRNRHGTDALNKSRRLRRSRHARTSRYAIPRILFPHRIFRHRAQTVPDLGRTLPLRRAPRYEPPASRPGR